MNALIKFLSSDKILLWSILISLALLFFDLLYLLIIYRILPPFVPVYNQLPWGPERLGSRLEFFFPAALTLVILFINIALIRFLYDRIPLVARMLAITTFLLSLLTTIFLLRITQLII